MAGIPDTRGKGNKIGQPPGKGGPTLNGKQIDGKAMGGQPKGGGLQRELPSTLNNRTKAISAAPHTAWVLARIAQFSLLLATFLTMFGGFAIVFGVAAIFYAIAARDKIASRIAPDWFDHWVPDDWIEQWLPSRFCPECGQSIFKLTNQYGYTPDFQLIHLLPSKHCANCGHDHTQAMPHD